MHFCLLISANVIFLYNLWQMEALKLVGSKINYFEILDSTNNYTIEKIRQNGIFEGEVVVCGNQTQGKGQRGNIWESEANKNLTCSIYLKPTFLRATEQFLLNQFICVSLFEYLQEKKWDVEVRIKWPNDILINGKKVAGILIENLLKGSLLEHAVIGIGLNLNQEKFFFRENESKSIQAVALKEFNKTDLDPMEELNTLLGYINKNYFAFKENPKKFKNEYCRNLYKMGEYSDFIFKNEPIKARIIGVEDSGVLILEDLNFKEFSVNFKEIIFL